MAELAQRHQERLTDIKKNIEDACAYFKDNVDRYHKYVNFVFNTSITDADRKNLATLQKPALEFNVLEAYVSRLRGEFAKQEPSITVRAADGVPVQMLTKEFIETLDVVEAHLREIFFDASNDNLEYNVYSDLLAGGFSVVEVYNDYVNEMSFEQNIYVQRAFDPTLTGFDPLARESHKGDGRFCFQIVPKTKEEFAAEFGEESLKDIKFHRSENGFNWAYKNQNQDIVLVVDFYEKKPKRTKIVKLSNGHMIEKKHYEYLLQEWEARGLIEQPPIIIEERTTNIETIVRYRLSGNKVLDYVETDYKYLPLVFVDGNSINVKGSESGANAQMTRPFVYHALGVQKLKNFSGQTIAAEIENMVMHKFKVALESIPEDYLDAYQNVQQADVLMYNAYSKDDPGIAYPPPMEIQRTPTPTIVENTFMGMDQVTQTILGSYDSALGINGNQLSGVAIQQGAMQCNAAAMPYLMGYVKGLNRIAQIIVDLIPKYYVTPRSLPIMKSDGKRSFQIINDPRDDESISLKYDPNHLQIKVEAGVSSAVQKQVALDQIIRMMQSSEIFAQFINTKGLETILDNLDIRGIDGLKQQAVEFMEEMQAQQEAAAQQPDAMQQIAETQKEIEFAKIEQRRLEAEGQNAVATAKVAIEKQKADTDFIALMAEIRNDDQKTLIQQEKADAEIAKDAVETAMSFAKMNQENLTNLSQGVDLSPFAD